MSFNGIFYVYLAVLFLATIPGFVRYKRLNKAFRVVTILLFCTFISEATKKIYGQISHNSMPQAHVWAVIEFGFFSLTYYYLITSPAAKRSITYAMTGMVVLEIANVFFFEKLTQFPSLILEVSHIVYVIYSLLLFRQMLFSPSEQSLFKQSLFWLNINMLFYATTMFLNYALLSYFIENKLDALPLVYFAYVINFTFYIVIGITLLMNNRRPKISVLKNG